MQIDHLQQLAAFDILAVVREDDLFCYYRVAHEAYASPVIVQLLKSPGDLPPSRRHRLRKMMEDQMRLRHAGIQRVLAVQPCQDGFYVILEDLSWETLTQLLERKGEFNRGWVVRLMRKTLEILAYAHEQGRAHGCLSPDHIYVSENQDVKLSGFGMAATSAGAIRPSSRRDRFYTAPEQVQQLPWQDWRSDLYSLAMIAYEALVGELPLDNRLHGETLVAAILDNNFTAPDQLNSTVPAGIGAIIMRGLSRRPERRYRSAEAMLEALNRFNPYQRPRRQLNRTAPSRRWWLLLMPVLLTAGGALLYRQPPDEPPPPALPLQQRFSITSEPLAVTIFINEDSVGQTPLIGYASPPESLLITARAVGHRTVDTVMVFADADSVSRLHINLPSVPVATVPAWQNQVSITSRPSGARIYVDHQFRGIAPLRLENLPPAKYRVGAVMDGYRPAIRYVEIGDNQRRQLPFRLKSYGNLVIYSQPSGAEVLVNGQVLGKTPYRNPRWLPGRPVVHLRKNGYHTVADTLVVHPGKTTLFSPALLRQSALEKALRTN